MRTRSQDDLQERGWEMEKTKGISRRSFLGASVVAGAGAIAGMSALSSCSPSVSSSASDDAASGGVQGAAAQELNPQDESYSSCTSDDFSALFEPLQIGPLTLRNRLAKSPAGSDTWNPEGESLNANYLDYYENFAKGGASIVFIESSNSRLMKFDVTTHQATGWLVEDISKIPEKMAPVTERIHQHGAYAGFQFCYGMIGAGTDLFGSMSIDDIAWTQDISVEIIKQLKDAGVDIIQLHCAATQLFKYTMIKRENSRTDQYGADTLENRTRYVCELISKVKEACGEDYPVQILMDAFEENDTNLGDSDGYLTIEESIEDAKMMQDAGADSFYLRLSVPGRHIVQFAPDLMYTGYHSNGMTGFGTMADFSQHFDKMVMGQYSGCGILLKATVEFKKNLSVPITCAGYMDPRTAPDLMCNAVKNGEVDYLMINRPLTVDPELPNKLQEGRRDEIAPCCRCMHCHVNGAPAQYLNDNDKEFCRVNATTQHAYTDEMPEGYELPPAETSKKVMVIGGDPAGMEAARIAALRGHTVSLYEKDSLGGLVNTAHAFKGDHERLGDLVEYLKRQQEVTGVQVNTGVEVTADIVSENAPDVVVVAVGGSRETRLEATSNVNVVGIDGLNGSDIGENVVICGAGAQAIDCALFLLAQGKKIQMVHEGPKNEIDKEQSVWVRSFVIPHLQAKGVKMWSEAKIGSLTDEGLAITTSSGVEKTLACNTVVECFDMIPNTSLYDEISSKYETYAVGDCAEPVDIAHAIKMGNLAGRAI